MASETAQTAATAMERTINQLGGTEDAEYIINHLCSMHRTLNQAFVSRIVIPFIREMAQLYSMGNFDLRNKEACRICRIMFDAVKSEYDLADNAQEVRLPMI